jgi:L-threonylcarbamoyladenylate synthase
VVNAPDPPDPLDRAVAVLGDGGIVALATDTVYGIAALPTDPRATGTLFALKHRSRRAPLAVLVADPATATPLVDPRDHDALERLAAAFWPGPLTVIVRRRSGLDFSLGDDGATIGLRSPAHPLARALIDRTGPLAVTSANRSGEPPATSAPAVAAIFGERVLVLDGGVCDALPSTVVTLVERSPRLIRAGAVGLEAIVDALGSG